MNCPKIFAGIEAKPSPSKGLELLVYELQTCLYRIFRPSYGPGGDNLTLDYDYKIGQKCLFYKQSSFNFSRTKLFHNLFVTEYDENY